MLISLTVFLITILLSAMFSGAETGLYQLSRLRLRLALEKQQPLARVLTRALHDRPGLLTALLLGNNLTIQIATGTVTYCVVQRMEASLAAEWVAMAITTPVLFVFAELLPKNVFLYRADSLMLWLSPMVYGVYKVLRVCGAIQLMQFLVKWLARLMGTHGSPKALESNVRRHEIRVLLKDTQDEGFLSGLQQGIMNRMVSATVTPVKEVMTRMSCVHQVPLDCDRETLLAHLQNQVYTRVLVYDPASQAILGRINIQEVLIQEQAFASLELFVKPLQQIADKTSVTDAIEIMQREQQKLLLVTHTSRNHQTHPRGIVTMKDLAEELLGELAAW